MHPNKSLLQRAQKHIQDLGHEVKVLKEKNAVVLKDNSSLEIRLQSQTEEIEKYCSRNEYLQNEVTTLKNEVEAVKGKCVQQKQVLQDTKRSFLLYRQRATASLSASSATLHEDPDRDSNSDPSHHSPEEWNQLKENYRSLQDQMREQEALLEMREVQHAATTHSLKSQIKKLNKIIKQAKMNSQQKTSSIASIKAGNSVVGILSEKEEMSSSKDDMESPSVNLAGEDEEKEKYTAMIQEREEELRKTKEESNRVILNLTTKLKEREEEITTLKDSLAIFHIRSEMQEPVHSPGVTTEDPGLYTNENNTFQHRNSHLLSSPQIKIEKEAKVLRMGFNELSHEDDMNDNEDNPEDYTGELVELREETKDQKEAIRELSSQLNESQRMQQLLLLQLQVLKKEIRRTSLSNPS